MSHQEDIRYGGQAVIEGVMMRSPRFFAVACRRESKEIVVRQESVESVLKKLQWLNRPFFRGTLALIDAVVLGIKSLTFSANIAMEDIDSTRTKKASSKDSCSRGSAAGRESRKSQSINDITIGATMVLGLGLGVAIFMVGPHLLVGLAERRIGNSLMLNIAEGVVRIAIFVVYVAAISLMRDIRRVFEYHGAEHKVINTFEAGLDPTAENVSGYGTIHQRCGTSFILVVLVFSIVVYAFLGWADLWYERVVWRLTLLPVIAGLAYEVIRCAGRHKDSRVLNAVLSPGLWLQKLTTREPSDDQVEVALRALRAVLEKEQECAPLALESG